MRAPYKLKKKQEGRRKKERERDNVKNIKRKIRSNCLPAAENK